jgi:hypothetical protein
MEIIDTKAEQERLTGDREEVYNAVFDLPAEARVRFDY